MSRRVLIALVAAIALHAAAAALYRVRSMRAWLGPPDDYSRLVAFLEECARQIPEDATVQVPETQSGMVVTRLYPRRVVTHAAPGAWVVRFTWPFDRATAVVERPR